RIGPEIEYVQILWIFKEVKAAAAVLFFQIGLKFLNDHFNDHFLPRINQERRRCAQNIVLNDRRQTKECLDIRMSFIEISEQVFELGRCKDVSLAEEVESIALHHSQK